MRTQGESSGLGVCVCVCVVTTQPGEAREDPRINLLKRGSVFLFSFLSYPFEKIHTGTAGYGEGATLGQYAWTNSVLVLVPSPLAREARDNVCVCAKGKLQTDTHTIRTHAGQKKTQE